MFYRFLKVFKMGLTVFCLVAVAAYGGVAVLVWRNGSFTLPLTIALFIISFLTFVMSRGAWRDWLARRGQKVGPGED